MWIWGDLSAGGDGKGHWNRPQPSPAIVPVPIRAGQPKLDGSAGDGLTVSQGAHDIRENIACSYAGTHWSLAPRRGFGLHRAWLPWVATSQLNGIIGLEEYDAALFRELADAK